MSLHAFFFLCLHFKFTFTFTFHLFTTTEYYLLLLLSPHNPFTFKILFYLFILLPLNCVPTQPLLHRDVSAENNGCKMLGDIVISMERAQEQATLYGHPLQREVAFLTVHSMLHLLGYDHENGGLEAMRMREKEEAVLIQLGLPRTVSYTE